MLIVRSKKSVVLKVRDPNRITTVIPSAKPFQFNGDTLVAVKHGVDETRVLRNMGFSVPSPAGYYYEWPGMFKPFEAQRTTVDFLTLNPRAFCLNGMGSGKTLSTLWAFDYLRKQGKATRLLISAPLSTLERTWADEVFKHFPHLEYSVLYGTKEKRHKLLAQPADVYLVNHHGMKIIADALKGRSDIDIIAVDEIAQAARNAGTDIWKAHNTVCNKQVPRQVWGLTGTPTPNAPTDAWAQCRLVVPNSVPPYFNRFKDQVMKQQGPFTWVPRANATETVKEVMQPAIRFSLEDCADLPECTFVTRHVDLTEAQTKAYKEMLTKLKLEVDGGEVLAVNEAVKVSKLVQIACGVAYNSNSEEVTIDAKPRLDLVKEVIEEAGTKTIVFVPFVSSVGLVTEYLRSHGISVECIHGGVSKHERDTILSSFQKLSDPKVLVAIPSTMSHGLSLTAANTIVWYAPITSNDVYVQACARVRRPGQKHTQLIVNIEGTPVERKMYARLESKEKMQGILLDLVRGG
jgi:SNF2 family DNA or RNA helicase